mmetsp:Transcript_1076/g.2855  ORF Transcript_1076/g.2855 Transcript_1076/m.2855 type:complete len:208 (+) Transcript_1076:549-1172(+)
MRETRESRHSTRESRPSRRCSCGSTVQPRLSRPLRDTSSADSRASTKLLLSCSDSVLHGDCSSARCGPLDADGSSPQEVSARPTSANRCGSARRSRLSCCSEERLASSVASLKAICSEKFWDCHLSSSSWSSVLAVSPRCLASSARTHSFRDSSRPRWRSSTCSWSAAMQARSSARIASNSAVMAAAAAGKSAGANGAAERHDSSYG